MARGSTRSVVRQGIGGLMLRTTNPQPSLWEAFLPEPCQGLPAELARVDALLDDPRFFEPFRAHFDPILGRPSIPIETYLRLMFLKFRHRLGYELLCREVADSISWQRFCRIPLGGQVPHPTTLVKLTGRLGEQTVRALNEALLHTAAEHKLLRTHRVRVDTTVVGANVAYPTDAGLLTRAIGKLAATIGRIQAAGVATRTRVRDRPRSARRRAHQLARTLRGRSEQAKEAVLGATGELADLAVLAVGDAARVAHNARRHLARAGEQASGKLGKPVEFGYKAQVADNPDGVVLDYQVEVGNPPDAPLLVPAVQRISQRAGRIPQAVTADRQYGETAIDQQLAALGVERVAIPRKGQPGATRRTQEHTRGFRRLVKWRTGSEGRISHLKHRYGWDRTLMDGIDGARIWCGHGVLAHNLVKISGLIQAKQTG